MSVEYLTPEAISELGLCQVLY